MTNILDLGIEKGYISLSGDGKRITYSAIGKSYKFTGPEETIRAEYYVELVAKYGYLPERMGVEVVVPRRTPSDLADIVVFSDSRRKQPYIVVECKKDRLSDSEFLQATEQAFGNANSLRAPYAAVVAGNTRRFYDVGNHPASERTKNVIADIPVKYGRVEESKFKKGDPTWELQPVTKGVLTQTLAKCHDSLWDGGKMDATEAFDEMCKFIFVKMQDELHPRRKGTPYDFQIKTNETPHSVHDRISKLYEKAKQHDPEVFSDSFSTNREKTFSIVNHLEGISLSKTDLDTKGVAFENFMEDFFKGKQGQFFTPREIVRFIIDMCEVDENSLVLDPACGSGGFLLYAMDHVRAKASEYFESGTVEHYKHWHEFASNRLYGIEVNDRISRVAKMNMVLHDDGHTNVVCHDALDEMTELTKTNAGLKLNHFDVILTNPPFGATVKFDEKPYTNDYELGRTSKGVKRKEQQSEILFIERCWKFLKPGTGYLAIVLPDGILTNHGQNFVRDFLLRNFEIKAIVSLPQVTFTHYGAGAKSSVLVMRKRKHGEKVSDYAIFSAISEAVGYDATGRACGSDLSSIGNKFRAFKGRKRFPNEALIFSKNISEFDRNRLDPYYYSPIFDRIDERLSKSLYPLMSLQEICVDRGVFCGKTPKKKNYSEDPGDEPIVKVATLKRGRVDFGRVGRVKRGRKGAKTKTTRNGDILMLSAAHQADYLGRNPCIVETTDEWQEDVSFVAELMCVRVDTKKVNPYYLLQLLMTETYYLLVNRERRGQTSHIYPRDIKNIKIPVPPMDTQNRNASSYMIVYAKYRKYIDDANRFIEEATVKFDDEFMPSEQKSTLRVGVQC